MVTLTTAGYGDIAPVTTAGRVLAVVLMMFGIGFVGMVTATLATYFLGQSTRTEGEGALTKARDLVGRLDQLSQEEIEALKVYLEAVLSKER